MHKRKEIRDAFVSAVTGLSTTGSSVFVSRVYPLDSDSLPAICVYSKRERSEPITMGVARTYERNLEITAEIYVRGVSGYDDLLDQISAEIENAIYAAGDFNGLIKDIFISQTDVNYQDGAEQPLGSAELEFNIIYTTVEGSVTGD